MSLSSSIKMLPFVIFGLAFASVHAWSAETGIITACAATLRTDVTVMQNNYAMQVAYLDSIDQSRFDQAKTSGALSLILSDINANSSFTDFQTSKVNFERKVNMNFSSESSEGYLSYALSTAGTDAFSKCVKDAIGKEGMHIEVIQMTPSTANFMVHWVMPAGVVPPVGWTINLKGGTIIGKEDAKPFQTTAHFPLQINRDAATDLSIGVTTNLIKGEAKVLGDSLLIPAYMKIVRHVDRGMRSSDLTSRADCGNVTGTPDGSPKPGSPIHVAVLSANEKLIPSEAFWTNWNQSSNHGAPEGNTVWDVSTEHLVVGHVICNPVDAGLGTWVSATFAVPSETTSFLKVTSPDSFP